LLDSVIELIPYLPLIPYLTDDETDSASEGERRALKSEPEIFDLSALVIVSFTIEPGVSAMYYLF